jgi:hypothetical protein
MREQLGPQVEQDAGLVVARMARHAAVVGIAGLVSGVLVAGLGGRLLMRIAAILAPEGAAGALTESGARVGEITLDGTLALVILIGLISGGIGAVLFLVSEPWLARAGRYRGPVFGLFLLLIASRTSDALDPDNFDFALVGNQAVVIGMFVALFILFGALLPSLATFLERRLPEIRPERSLLSASGYITLTLPGLLFVATLVLFHVSEDACGCEPQYVLGVLLLTMATATAIVQLAPLDRDGRPRRAAVVVGYLSLAAATLVGGYQAISDIVEIV